MRAQTTIGLIVLALLGAASAARALTIADLVASPDAYEGQTVTVIGNAVAPVPVRSESAFDLRDGAAVVTVLSRGRAPAAGARLSVTGTVHVVHQGDEPEDINFPPVLTNSSFQPAP